MKGSKITDKAARKVSRFLQSADRRFAFMLVVSDKQEEMLHFVQAGFPDGATVLKILEQTVKDLRGDPDALEALVKARSTDDQEVLEREIRRNPESFTKEDN